MHREAPWILERNKHKKRFRYFARFDPDEIADCLRHLVPDEDDVTTDRSVFELSMHRMAVGVFGYIMIRLVPVVGFLCFASMAVIIPAVLRAFSSVARNNPLDTSLVASELVVVAVAGLVISLYGHWELRFLRAVARTQKIADETYASVYRVAQCANMAGRAAKYLFRDVQGRRFTWVSPPAVADRALALSSRLINVELDHHADLYSLEILIGTYAEFLYFASGLVAAKRAELIPVLRDYYATDRSLAYRVEPGPEGIVPERDALFLDPMRNHDRWAIVKDYLYPLASWMSLLVSVTALILSLAK
jgi:hypothetical protein